jgi:acylphosphatase
MTEAAAITLQLRISGRVQGVGYRMSMVAVAQQLGLLGWVRNRRDGTVEAMVQGNQAAVDDLLAWAHQGPPSARVDAVEATPGDGAFIGFAARPDA